VTFGTLFTSVEHAFASTAKWIAKEAKSTSTVIAKIQAAAPTIEAGTQAVLAVVDPPAAIIAAKLEDLGFAALGKLANAATSTAAAATGGFASIPLDVQELSDYKAVAVYLAAQLAAKGTPITSASVVPVPVAAPTA
jgi:hypothetical protein